MTEISHSYANHWCWSSVEEIMYACACHFCFSMREWERKRVCACVCVCVCSTERKGECQWMATYSLFVDGASSNLVNRDPLCYLHTRTRMIWCHLSDSNCFEINWSSHFMTEECKGLTAIRCWMIASICCLSKMTFSGFEVIL